MAVAIRGARRGHRWCNDRGSTMVEVAVATVLVAASVAIIGAGLQMVTLLGERATAADAGRRAVEAEIARWSSAVMPLCTEGQASLMEALPTDAMVDEPPMAWSAGGQWHPLTSTDCAEIVASGFTGPTVLRWRLQAPPADSVEIVTRAVWP